MSNKNDLRQYENYLQYKFYEGSYFAHNLTPKVQLIWSDLFLTELLLNVSNLKKEKN